MNEDEKEHLLSRIQTLIHEVAYTGGWEYTGEYGEYKLTPYLSTQCPEIEAVINHLVNALGSLESIETED